jgi:hypothetical protein
VEFSDKPALSTGLRIGEVSAQLMARRGFLESTWNVMDRNLAVVG